ncbi:GNAT family N-acetyltransferase [Candidatus Falkowbacteria bacterium]|nr:GNAT family N-acetyltransferase [Candidatus Falkowbacteria bacterium]
MEKIMETVDGGLYSAIIPFSAWKETIGKMRYEIFVELLGWVKGDPTARIELDEYDEEATHLAVFRRDEKEIISYARILEKNPRTSIMLENDTFKKLLPAGFVIPASSIEVSRLCRRGKYAGLTGMKANLLVFRAVLLYAETSGYEEIFAIADTKDARGYSHVDFLLKHFTSFKKIGHPLFFQKGVETWAMTLTTAGLRNDLKKYENI